MFEKTISFIKELYGNQEFIPLSVPKFIGNEKKYLNECIDTTFVSSVGKFVDRFENDMAAYTGAKRAVVCVSGTNALHMALMLVGVSSEMFFVSFRRCSPSLSTSWTRLPLCSPGIRKSVGTSQIQMKQKKQRSS